MEQNATGATLEVISDVICPWCYIGKQRLKQAHDFFDDETRLRVLWRPYQLNPKMPPGGAERKAYYASKFGSETAVSQLLANITANAKEAGLSINYDRIERVPNTLNAHRLIWFAERDDVQDAVVDGLFAAYFVEGRDLGDLEVLADIAGRAGLDRSQVHAFLRGNEGTDLVRDAATEAHKSGIQGVPAFRFNGRYLFSGAQSPETISLSIKRAIKKGL